MNPLLSALCTLLLLAACTNRQPHSPKEKDTARPTDSSTGAPADVRMDTTFRPGFFTSFPDTVDGCSSYFTYDTTAMEKGRYIFLSNYSDLA